MTTRKMVKVTLVRSLNARLAKHISCVRGLGLKKMHQSIVIDDTPCNRGMMNKASYLLKVEEV